MKVSKLKFNPDNPRKISPAHLEKLKKSIKDFPQMMELRPIVYDPANMQVLGGNQRLSAIKALDMAEIPDSWVLSADKLSDHQKKEFILKDNIPLGEWDFAILETAFDEFDLGDMGIEVPQIGDIDGISEDPQTPEKYTHKIEVPTYEPKNEKPDIQSLVKTDKQNELIAEIEASDIDADTKGFLIKAAQRHLVFDYAKIADFYAHSDATIQTLMEKSGLVIIDFEDAIANGYVKLGKEIAELYGKDYPDE